MTKAGAKNGKRRTSTAYTVGQLVGSGSRRLSEGTDDEGLPLAGALWRPTGGVPLYVGIDPGTQGAIVAVRHGKDGLSAVGVWSWAPVQRDRVKVWLMRSLVDGIERERVFATLWHASAAAVEDLLDRSLGRSGWVLTVEGLFGQGTTLERLSWYAGMVAGPWHARTVGTVERPMCSQWRPQVIDISPRMQKDAAEVAAIQWTSGHVQGLGRLGAIGHVCEAAAIAEWGRRHYAGSGEALPGCSEADGESPVVSRGDDTGA